jgi:hypothetical protein
MNKELNIEQLLEWVERFKGDLIAEMTEDADRRREEELRKPAVVQGPATRHPIKIQEVEPDLVGVLVRGDWLAFRPVRGGELFGVEEGASLYRSEDGHYLVFSPVHDYSRQEKSDALPEL